MGWLLHKLDSMAGAVFGAVLAGSASQGQAFTAAYLQRLGGRLDEAEDLLDRAREGTLAPGAGTATRAELVADLQSRVEALTSMRRELLEVPELWRPFALLWEMDAGIAAATLEMFTPALPLTLATLLHAAVGLLVGLLLWEGCKAPAIPVRRLRRRRREQRIAAATARMPRPRRRPIQGPSGPPDHERV